MTLDDVRRFHEAFYGASTGELVVVGKVEAAAVEAAAEEVLGSWETPNPYSPIVDDYVNIESVNVQIDTPDKENAQISAGLRFAMSDTHADYAAMVLANYMFGGGGLTARLPDRVRNREGLSYSVFSRFSAPVEGDAATFSASAIANPANVPRVEASFIEELTRTLAEGFTAEELVSAKRALLDQRIGGRSSDGGLLNLIAVRERMPWRIGSRASKTVGPYLAVGRGAGRDPRSVDAGTSQCRVPSPHRPRRLVHRQRRRFHHCRQRIRWPARSMRQSSPKRGGGARIRGVGARIPRPR